MDDESFNAVIDAAENRGRELGFAFAMKKIEARDAKIREDLELLEFYLAVTHGKKCSAWTLDVPPMLLKKVKKMKLLLVEEAKRK